jgi:hypothetical protein
VRVRRCERTEEGPTCTIDILARLFLDGHVGRLILVVAIVAAASSVAVATGASGQIIFRDDFSNRHSGWFVGHDKISVENYKDGQASTGSASRSQDGTQSRQTT